MTTDCKDCYLSPFTNQIEKCRRCKAMEKLRYLEGGIVSKPTKAVFGRDEPEAFIPMPDGKRIPVDWNPFNVD